MAVEPAFDLRPAAKRPAACVNFPDAGTVPVKLLKILSPYISQPLAIIFNASITLGGFPDKLKYAKVIPIHKKGSPQIPQIIDQSHSSLFSVRFLENLCTEDYTSFLTAWMHSTHFSSDLEKDILQIMH